VVNCGDRNGRIFSQISQSCHFRLGFQTWHEATGNARDQLSGINERNEVTLKHVISDMISMNRIRGYKPYGMSLRR
jgi:hypothetical protein